MDSTALTLFDMLAAEEKQSLNLSFKTRHTSLQETNNILKNTLIEIRRRKWKTHEFIWNPCLFLNTAAFDHSIQIHDLAFEKDPWKRRLIARNLCVLLFETAEDLPSVFGGSFNKALTTLGIPSELLSSFRTKFKSISHFWDKHRDFLKQIRIVCGAHRDHDAITLNRAIEEMDLMNVLRMSVDLGVILNEIGPPLQAILTATSTIAPPELKLKS